MSTSVAISRVSRYALPRPLSPRWSQLQRRCRRDISYAQSERQLARDELSVDHLYRPDNAQNEEITVQHQHQTQLTGSSDKPRSRYSRPALTAQHVLERLRQDQEPSTAAPSNNLNDDRATRDALNAFQLQLKDTDAELIARVITLSKAPSTRPLRQHSDFNDLVERYLSSRLSAWGKEQYNAIAVQSNGTVASTNEVSTATSIYVLLRDLRAWHVESPARQAKILGYSLQILHRHLHQVADSVSEIKLMRLLTDNLLCWYHILKPRNRRDATRVERSESLDWNFLSKSSIDGAEGQSYNLDTWTEARIASVSDRLISRKAQFGTALILMLFLERRLDTLMKQFELSRCQTYKQQSAPLYLFLKLTLDNITSERLPYRILNLFKRTPALSAELSSMFNPPPEPAESLSHSATSDLPEEPHSNDGSLTKVDEAILPAVPASTLVVEMKHQADIIIGRAGRAAEKQDSKQAARLLQQVASSTPTAGPRLPAAVYESLIRMFTALRKADEAFKVLQLMEQAGVQPDKKTWTTLLRRVAPLKDPKLIAMLWHSMLSSGIQPDSPAWSAYVYSLIRADEPIAAMNSLRAATSSSRPLDGAIGVANAALSAFAGDPKYEQHFTRVKAWMETTELKPDVNTFNVFINHAMRKGLYSEAISMIQQMRDDGANPDSSTSTILITGLLHSSLMKGRTQADAGAYLLAVLNDVEDVQIGETMTAKGYTTALQWAAEQHNFPASQALLQRMQSRRVALSAHTQTILLNMYLDPTAPMYEAFEVFWKGLDSANAGWGAVRDAFFYQRALERLSEHHRALGTDKLEAVMQRMIKQRIRPTWTALHSVVRAYHERGDLVNFSLLVQDIEQQQGIAAHGFDSNYGAAYFWSFVKELRPE